MSELIGRFFSFDEHLGRGLVKFAYYALLAVLVILSITTMIAAFLGLFSRVEGDFWANLGTLFVTPVVFVIQVMLLRVGAELVMSILAIEESVKTGNMTDEGFEAGLTPRSPAPSTPAAPAAPASSEASPSADHGLGTAMQDDSPDVSDDAASDVSGENETRRTGAAATKKRTTKKKTTKKTARKAAPANDGDDASVPEAQPSVEMTEDGARRNVSAEKDDQAG